MANKKMTREDAVNKLIEDEMDKIGADDAILGDILREGCVGYDNMDNERIEELYEQMFGETITIKG